MNIYIKFQFKCEYSLDNKIWKSFGKTPDGKLLSAKISGGFAEADFGLHAFAKTPAKRTFNWVSSKLIE